MSDPRADSVRARLLKRAQQHGEDFNLLLTRYALERWLYRLSASDERAGFVLKGALLFSLWFEHGVMEAKLLYESPFIDVAPQGPDSLFTSLQVDEPVAVLARIRATATAA